MNAEDSLKDISRARTEQVLAGLQDDGYRSTSRMFAWLMGGQWVFAVGLALVWSPHAWAGNISSTHVHVWTALLLGGVLSALPIALALTRPTATLTRQVMAVAQMLWSALLIHLSGGRIETHFHVFGSLAFLSFYRDWKVLPTATVAVAADHLLRGMLWPQSVYGSANPEWWRVLEHAFWVLFEDGFLLLACLRAARDLRRFAERQAEVEMPPRWSESARWSWSWRWSSSRRARGSGRTSPARLERSAVRRVVERWCEPTHVASADSSVFTREHPALHPRRPVPTFSPGVGAERGRGHEVRAAGRCCVFPVADRGGRVPPAAERTGGVTRACGRPVAAPGAASRRAPAPGGQAASDGARAALTDFDMA